MKISTLTGILAKYDIAWTDDAHDMLMAIVNLPSSDIFKLFNDIETELTFPSEEDKRLF